MNSVLTENALDLLRKRYFRKDLNETTWCQLADRVATAVADAETDEQLKKYWSEKFYNMIYNLEFLPSTPCLMNAYKESPGQLSSCFILDVKDNIESIYAVKGECAKIFQKNGGAGLNMSALRPSGSQVETSKGYSCGVVGFMEEYDLTADIVTRNNTRKGAMKVDLNDWHPDIYEFIHAKDDITKFKCMNISVSLSDKFMQAVLGNQTWDLKFPDYSWNKEIYDNEWCGDLDLWEAKGYPVRVYKTVLARNLYLEIMESAWKTGEPGVSFRDAMDRDNPNPHLGKIKGTNPCAEFTSQPYNSCNLGSINLSKAGKTKDEVLAWLKVMVPQAVRFLDNMITVNKLPLAKIDKFTKSVRSVGMGVMGFAHLLYNLGIPYNSKEGYEFADRLFGYIQDLATQTSIKLAEEKGVYDAWTGSNYDKSGIKIRNSNRLSIAPTGSISFIVNTSGAMEPVFSLVMTRRTNEGYLYHQVDPVLESELKKRGLYSESLLQKIADNYGRCTGIAEIPEDIQKVFVTAYDVSPAEHVKMLSVIQKHVDLSASKCVAKGTLIQTNKGVFPIEKLGAAQGEDVFGEALSDLMVRDQNGDWKKVLNHYSGGIKPTKKVYLDNGQVLEGTHVHRIMTRSGWKKLSDLAQGDLIKCRFADYSLGDRKGSLLIQFEHELNTSAKDIKFPTAMSESLALWLGMLAADGSSTESSGAVVLTCANDEVEKLFSSLTYKLFGQLTSVEYDRRTDTTRACKLTSRNLVRFVQSLIGKGCRDKHIPEQILNGSVAEQKAFLRGLTLDGYVAKRSHRNELVIYEGYSEILCDQALSLCYLLGMAPYKSTKKVPSGRLSKKTFGLHVDCSLIEPLETHKQCRCEPKDRIVDIPEKLKIIKVSAKHPKYNTLRTLRRRSFTTTVDSVLNDFEVAYDIDAYYVTVKSVEDGVAEVYDIEVEDTHSYLVNGIVSHNTVNLPNSATVQDVMDVYIDAWKQGIKGITIYRDGCRDNQVLTVGSKKQEEDQKVTLTTDGYVGVEPAMEVAYGKRIKVKTGCGHLWLFFFVDAKHNLAEIWSQVSGGGCKANIESMSRLVSLAFRAGIDPKHILDQLSSAFCKTSMDNVGSKSCGHVIAKQIREFLDSNETIIPVDKNLVDVVENLLYDIHPDPEIEESVVFFNDEELAVAACSTQLDQEECDHVFDGQGCQTCIKCGYNKCS